MTVVGIRELKNRLSEFLRHVRDGETVLVTDRGRVIAELRRPGSVPTDEVVAGLERLTLRGKASAVRANDPELYPQLGPLLPAGQARSLLDEERGEH